VNQTSGISANGIPNESTTWLITRVRDGSRPIAATTSAGTIVTRRRTNSGICRSMKPCMTTCPERVPTVELDSPDASRASAKSVPEALPRIGSSVWCAVSSDAMSVRPDLKKTEAAITSMAILIRPAIDMATITSTFV
jgi:hypothetical protein